MRVGVFGGSFDPVHAGHLHVARAAMRAFELNRIVFIPARESPHKPGAMFADGVDRTAMLELAVADEPRWLVATLELERPGPSYTVDTLRELPEHLGLPADCELFLILGGDNLTGLPDWKDVDEVLLRARPIVVVRTGEERVELERIQERMGGAVAEELAAGLLELPPVPLAATDLRAALGRGELVDESLPPHVGEYIRARGIYAPA